MSEQDAREGQTPLKIFSTTDVVRQVRCVVHLPKLYPGYQPWEFLFRLQLSSEMQKQRERFLGLAAVEREKQGLDQAVDEVCDLLLAEPTGFADFPGQDSGKPLKERAKEYVTSQTDEQVRLTLKIIYEGASLLYWNSISPREFLETV
jgi:hypothetical protein